MPANLHRMAVLAAQKAYAPYSNFPVGATIRTSDGRVYSGCNVENVSYPEGWCAETSAIAHMVMDGGGEIAEIAVSAPKMDSITPCGGCRQRIAEFGTPDTLVHLCDKDGVVESIRLADLLPKAFSKL
ncbi:MAG: cytidine deaminase [Rhizobiaceae bacterium]|nr:cytidine deaminase [Rhizobiaceae bacterium]